MAPSASPSQASLLRLPDELLLDVLNWIDLLQEPCRTISLHSLNLANRRLHGLSAPYLYSTFSFYSGAPHLFCRTISQNRDLASHVKVISWDYDTSAPDAFIHRRRVLAAKQPFYSADICVKLAGMTKLSGNPVSRQLALDIGVGRVYLGDLRVLDVLLLFTQNLERLYVVETYRWDDHTYWFKPILYGAPVNFSRLTSAMLHGPMRLENVAGLLLLPSMRCIVLTQVIEMRQEWDRAFQWEISPEHQPFKTLLDKRGSNIERFHLLDSYLNLEDVGEVVRAMRGLKSFTYEHEPNDLSVEWRSFEYKTLVELLMHHQRSLTSIRLSYKRYSMIPRERSVEPDRLFTTVKDFPNLTDLELPYISETSEFCTPTWEQLPANLEELAIDYVIAREYIECTESFTELEHNLLALAVCKRRGELQKLRKLTFKNWHPWYGSFPRNISYIGRMLKEVGIQLSSVPTGIGVSMYTMEDIGWVELQSEPEWVLVERYRVDEQ